MKTLAELNILRDNGKLDYAIEYVEGAELDDEFIEMQIVNPENEQKLLYAWVPADMEQELEDEKELANTDRYYDWTSTWTRFQDRYEDEEFYEDDEDFEEFKKEVVAEWNTTDLGSRYPIDTDAIDCDFGNTNRVFFKKEFNIF